MIECSTDSPGSPDAGGAKETFRINIAGLIGSCWPCFLAVFAGTAATYVAVAYSGQPLLEWEAFRQTQTALTSYWMLEEGWQLAYQTPVLGYPWAIPLEFPIFQTIVALIVWLCGFPLDSTGRLVSFCFLLACAWPAFRIARRLHLPSEVAWIFCALLWSSPIYVFWARTFLMDTAAVFFVLAAISYALDLLDSNPRWQSALYFGIFASLGLLQKAPTAAPALLVIGLVVVIAQIRQNGFDLAKWRQNWFVGISLLVPVIIIAIWTSYAASVRAENYFGGQIALKSTYLGPWKMRRNPALWRLVLWDRIFLKNAAGWLGVALIAAGLACGTNKLRVIIGLSLLLCLLPIFVFFKSHWFLEYYQIASVVFVLAALAVSVYVLQRNFSLAAPVFAVILVLSNGVNFAAAYGEFIQKRLTATNSRALAVGDVIRRYTPKDGRIVVFGVTSYEGPVSVTSYSSEIVYYSQRKGLTVEDIREKKLSNDLASYLGGQDPAAIVMCGPELGRYKRFIRQYDKNEPPNIFRVLSCYVWLPDTRSIILADGTLQSPIREAF